MDKRDATHRVMVGDVPIGAGAPVVVQSMVSVDTKNVTGVLDQISSLVDAGCEVVRVAIPHKAALDAFQEICTRAPIPVIADIHFDHKLAIEAAKRGATKLRINPGNIGSWDRVDSVIDAADEAGIPIRIGVNAGSLEDTIREKGGWSLEDKLVASSLKYVDYFEKRGFVNIVLSAKGHDVMETVRTYQRLSDEVGHIPLHLGITEAGTYEQGTVKSSVGLGMLLAQGIGDTMRVSLTAPVEAECRVAWSILAAVGLRRRYPEIVSCPTCGRCQVDLVDLANTVTDLISSRELPISVAVMGCEVNGPGEARDADIGVACGRGGGVIFVHGETLKRVQEDQIVSELMKEIETRFM